MIDFFSIYRDKFVSFPGNCCKKFYNKFIMKIFEDREDDGWKPTGDDLQAAF